MIRRLAVAAVAAALLFPALAEARSCLVRDGVVRLSRPATPSDAEARRLLFGDAGDAATRPLAPEGTWRACPDGAGEDWSVDAGGAWVPPAAPVVAEIPIRTLLFALRDQGWITHAEALAAARTGAMPARLSQTLAGAVQAGMLTAREAEDAELTWAAMYQASRADPLWSLFVAAGVATPAQVDALFTAPRP